MATITAIKDGNWHQTDTWDTATIPENGDDINLDDYNVEISSTNRVPSVGTINSLTTATGYISFPADSLPHTMFISDVESSATNNGVIRVGANNNLTIQANIKGSTSAVSGIGILQSGGILKVNGDITGGSLNDTWAINKTSGYLEVNGNVTGGSNIAAYAITLQDTLNEITVINGQVEGNVSRGAIYLSGTSILSVPRSNIFGGVTLGRGIYINTASSTIYIYDGNIYGGSDKISVGVYNNSTSTVLVRSNLIYTESAPIAGNITFLPNGKYIRIAGKNFYMASREIIGATNASMNGWGW